MNKKTKSLPVILGLIVLMAVPVFANQDALRNHRSSWGTGRQRNIEIIAEKVGVSVEELLEKRETGSCCRDLLEEYGLSVKEIRQARPEQNCNGLHHCKRENHGKKESHGKRKSIRLNMNLRGGY